MVTWYSASDSEAQERLGSAWSDAPIENAELCDMILDTAREQVIAYAPATTPPVYEPVSFTWETGERVELSRRGDIVTATVFVQQDAIRMFTSTFLLPDAFAIYPGLILITTPPEANPSWSIQVSEAMQLLGGFGTVGPYSPSTFTVTWPAGPAEGDAVPARYVYAQLQQARNLWNSGRTTGEGDVGPDGFVFRPYPLDKTIKQIIRPVDGKPHVL
ncbi:MAG: hypothetical protein WBA87_12415 [Microbacterium sp.]